MQTRYVRNCVQHKMNEPPFKKSKPRWIKRSQSVDPMSAGFSSATAVADNENVFVDIISMTSYEETAAIGTALIEGGVQRYCRTFWCLFLDLSNHLENRDCDVAITLEIILNDSFYIMRCEREC